MQQNLNAMAVKIGEMQAQLTRLDALGERLSAMAGIRPQEFRFSEAPGLGGAQSTTMPPQNLTLTQFNEKVAMLSRQMENRTDMLGRARGAAVRAGGEEEGDADHDAGERARSTRRASASASTRSPASRRCTKASISSPTSGTPVVAAAGGVVQFAGFHPQYGNMIDIDHGNDLVTRYAHLSKVLVKEGDVLQRGRRIADSGNTGRSTGPHLHFEVRFRGAAQNPTRFLLAANPQVPLGQGEVAGSPPRAVLPGVIKSRFFRGLSTCPARPASASESCASPRVHAQQS